MDSFIAEFERFAGAERFAKFVMALRGQARAENRLMYWQEALLREFCSASELSAPQSLDEVVSLFAVKPMTIELGIVSDRLNLVESPISREFRSVKQHASGGSHVTVFEVKFHPEPSSSFCAIEDRAGPHDDSSVATEIIESFAQAVSRFQADCKERGQCFKGFRIQLTSYVYGSTDFKPLKHQMGMYFLLKDILSETLTGRTVQAKLVGIPL
ncbi:hypothetical protein SAMN05518865_103346 [Duganella sp. CF458]|uniref:hypothetical protein n=1 Tax=Duganella sp. CF458 TaxID=1884368 RepID=UPI0008E92972|nr:hypothetical protein [Duganella sp. CF458]SFF71023.1 hypothetical protein SAMN05518865_103346 [Duganella sp. CF458]